MGAWIETPTNPVSRSLHAVAPFVGAWIETKQHDQGDVTAFVAPFVGAWIETLGNYMFDYYGTSRSLRGSVD